MSFSYKCPNPDCGTTLKTATQPAVGKTVKCPKCTKPFVPEPAGGAGTPKTTGEGAPAGKPAKPGAKPAPAKTGAKPEPAKAEAKGSEPPKAEAAPAPKSPFADDDEEDQESIKKGYGVVKETEEELEAAEKNKPKFGEVQDKFKKSARGPAQALLVTPSNLLILMGLLVLVGGCLVFLIGAWPLLFNDAPPGEEEMQEAMETMFYGMILFIWGALVCYGASHMHELGSYAWSMAGSILGVPLIVGIYGIVMLQNPEVKAGFEEGEGGPDDDEEDEDEDEEDEDEEDDEDEDEKPKKKAKAKSKEDKKKADDAEDEDEDDKKKPAKKPAPKAKAKSRKGKDDEDEDEE